LSNNTRTIIYLGCFFLASIFVLWFALKLALPAKKTNETDKAHQASTVQKPVEPRPVNREKKTKKQSISSADSLAERHNLDSAYFDIRPVREVRRDMKKLNNFVSARREAEKQAQEHRKAKGLPE